jgi:predicted RNase H-like HicB family nuclease
MKYLIVIEKTNTGFSAFTPDIDGCVATGKTKEEVRKNMRDALDFHLEGLFLSKQDIPKPYTCSDYVELAAMA